MAIKKSNKLHQEIDYKKQQIVEQIKAILIDDSQNTVIGPTHNHATLLEEFKLFLEYSGYIVTKVNTNIAMPKSAKDLVLFFYLLLQKEDRGRRCSFGNSIKETTEDMAIMKGFVENRAKAIGCSRQVALLICAEIIEILIKYEHYFKFSEPIYSTRILSINNIDWISKKAYEIKSNPLTYSIDRTFHRDEEVFEEKVLKEFGEESMLGFEL